MKFLLKHTKATNELASLLAEVVRESPLSTHARVIALSGELGSGKTTFAQSFARALGVRKRLLSPTFALRTIHKTKNKVYPILEHYDWYRLKGTKELTPTGWKEALKDPKRILLVEWPQRAHKALPKEYILVKLAHTSKQERTGIIQFYGK